MNNQLIRTSILLMLILNFSFAKGQRDTSINKSLKTIQYSDKNIKYKKERGLLRISYGRSGTQAIVKGDRLISLESYNDSGLKNGYSIMFHKNPYFAPKAELYSNGVLVSKYHYLKKNSSLSNADLSYGLTQQNFFEYNDSLNSNSITFISSLDESRIFLFGINSDTTLFIAFENLRLKVIGKIINKSNHFHGKCYCFDQARLKWEYDFYDGVLNNEQYFYDGKNRLVVNYEMGTYVNSDSLIRNEKLVTRYKSFYIVKGETVYPILDYAIFEQRVQQKTDIRLKG